MGRDPHPPWIANYYRVQVGALGPGAGVGIGTGEVEMTIDGGVYYIGDPPMVQMGNIAEEPSCGLNMEHKLTKLGTRWQGSEEGACRSIGN